MIHPVDDLAVALFLDGDMGHGRGWRGPVPMLFAGGEPNHVSGADLFDGSAFALSPAAASRHDQGLPERMSMPSRADSGYEGDAGGAGPRRFGALEQRVDTISAKIWAAFFDSAAALGVRKGGVAASAGSAAGRAALVEEGWLAEAFRPVERRGASGRAASGGQRRGRVIEPVRQRLDQKGQEKMGQNPRLCGALIEAWRFF